MKKILTFVCLTLIIIFVSCVPQQGTTQKNTAAKNNSSGGRITRETQNGTAETERVREIPQNSEKMNRTNKNRNSRGNTSSNPFEDRKNTLKKITDESERFIDTTYYTLTMEDGITKSSEIINLAGSQTHSREYRENLIKSFIETVEKFENSNTFDCYTFKVFANQFTFNDSLRQEANFYFAECCIGNNSLDEAEHILEEMLKERLNRGVAPKAIVRLGQLNCVLGDTKKAERYFRKLKKEFPRSIYNQVADCSKL